MRTAPPYGADSTQRQNFFADAIDHHFDRIDESMVFGRSADVRPIRPAAQATAIA